MTVTSYLIIVVAIAILWAIASFHWRRQMPRLRKPECSAPPGGAKELKRCFWVFIGSFFITPLALALVDTFASHGDFSFHRDYFDIYRALFSSESDMLFVWLIFLAPVVLYQVALACRHYYRHPDQLRSIFKFPPRHRR